MFPTKQQKQMKRKDPDEHCRLRHRLNPHCLAEIFQYLNDTDLIRVSGMNKFYENIISNYVISKKVITFQLSTTRCEYIDIFQKFGEKIKKIHFIGDPGRFKFLLQNIVEYCAEDQLEDVRFTKVCEFYSCNCEQNYRVSITPKMIAQMIPYFRNVQSVTLRNSHLRKFGPQWHVPQTIFSESTNIQILKLNKVLLNDDQLRWEQMKNLRDITLIDLQDFNQSTFIEYLKRRPKLTRFMWKGNLNIGDIGITLAKYCGDTITSFRHYGQDSTPVNIRTRYEFVSEFKNLTHVTMTSIFKCATDLYYPFEKLAHKNMLESLEIYQNGVKIGPSTPAEEALIEENIGEFKKLTRLTINVRDTDDCDPQHLQFILKRPPHILQNVSILTLSGNRSDKNISKIIDLLPNLRQLRIIDLRICNSLLGTRKMVTSIRKLVEKRGTGDGELKRKDFVDVIAYGEVWREFAVYENKYINLANRGTAREVQDFAIQGTAKIPRLDL